MHRVICTHNGEHTETFESNQSLLLQQFLMWLEREHIEYAVFESRLFVSDEGKLITIWKQKHEQEVERN